MPCEPDSSPGPRDLRLPPYNALSPPLSRTLASPSRAMWAARLFRLELHASGVVLLSSPSERLASGVAPEEEGGSPLLLQRRLIALRLPAMPSSPLTLAEPSPPQTVHDSHELDGAEYRLERLRRILVLIATGSDRRRRLPLTRPVVAPAAALLDEGWLVAVDWQDVVEEAIEHIELSRERQVSAPEGPREREAARESRPSIVPTPGIIIISVDGPVVGSGAAEEEAAPAEADADAEAEAEEESGPASDGSGKGRFGCGCTLSSTAEGSPTSTTSSSSSGLSGGVCTSRLEKEPRELRSVESGTCTDASGIGTGSDWAEPCPSFSSIPHVDSSCHPALPEVEVVDLAVRQLLPVRWVACGDPRAAGSESTAAGGSGSAGGIGPGGGHRREDSGVSRRYGGVSAVLAAAAAGEAEKGSGRAPDEQATVGVEALLDMEGLPSRTV